MRRREFVALLGSAAALSLRPLPNRAQQRTIPTIGFLHSQSPDGYDEMVSAFPQGLKEQGFTVGQNVAIEYRWANNEAARIPALATELARRPVAVIVAGGGAATAIAAKAATTTIPIVFANGADPVRQGL
ncbi:MAG TPA: ABC transporter substrate binding protein, partial [Candidatus Saccharimonadia bacterium]|nr:ABC transporter substrate binding protein [Candidatus Saccharimonadia bacterium]